MQIAGRHIAQNPGSWKLKVCVNCRLTNFATGCKILNAAHFRRGALENVPPIYFEGGAVF